MSMNRGVQDDSGNILRHTTLVVDDEKLVCDLIEMVLSEAGFDVLSAEDIPACLETLESQPGRVKLVILDRSIPGGDAIQLVERFHRELGALPILITSGYYADEKVESLVAQGKAAFLQKPFRPDELLNLVNRLLRN